jgi:hypothetical protein
LSLAAIAAALAWYVWHRATKLPVHSVTQAYALGCTDFDTGGDCHPYRVGGTVIAGSVKRRFGDALEFSLTDGCLPWLVIYVGNRADFARLKGGDFVVAQGRTSVDGEYWSNRIFTGSNAAKLRGDMYVGERNSWDEGCDDLRKANVRLPLAVHGEEPTTGNVSH